jgi:sulfur carrier protein|tara:strand:+ start:25 stop:228 length:204 start_codon:yes stop_codon:yes gene_type:complete
MAKIQLNGKKILIKQNFSISDILSKYKINGKKVAVELNGKILSQNRHKITKIKNNDKIEIVQFIGGG